MKKYSIGSKLVALLLVLTMIVVSMPVSVFAAKGDLVNVATGLDGNTIDTSDTISLPIQILDYDADGMLFEYAESNEAKSASDFGATWAADFASLTSINIENYNSMYGDFWGYTTETLNTSNGYASFLRATWAGNSTLAPHTFNGSRAGTIMPNDLNLSMDNARYLVLVYRTNVTNGKIGFFVERANADRSNTNNRVGNFDLPYSVDNWTYAVYDLKTGNLANTWNSYGNANAIWTTLPMDSSGEYIDIAHVALFADPDKAEAFGEYALTDGSNRGDNRGFGLLRSSRNQDGTAAFIGIADWSGTSDTIQQINTYSSAATLDFSTITNLGYTLLGTFAKNGIANVGLLQPSLVNGKPVYKEEVVAYLAELLQHSLSIPERTTDGWKNYRYIGSALANDLRERITDGLGTYPTGTAAEGLIGTWDECEGNIRTYYDAAYFLLNSIFVDGSYNTPKDGQNNEAYYDYLVLSAGIDSETGEKIYVFDGGFTDNADPTKANVAIDYNATTHTIQNTSAAGKTHFYYEWFTTSNQGNTTTMNPFLPITDKNNAEGQTVTPYYQDDGVVNIKKEEQDTLVNRNYNFVMYSSGEFVYYADDELYFDFEGDDDVYLFINGVLVMDIGSAHSIDGVRFELNDYVEAAKAGTLANAEQNKKLQLQEGDTYSFDFFYMERHSYGSNIRINTNIHITDPSMITEKTAYQDGVQIDYGSIIDKDKIVEYGFSITNNGNENLYNLSFTDSDIGVTLDSENGLTVKDGYNGVRVFDVNGGTLEATDLTAVLSGKNPKTGEVYDDITITFEDNDALKHFLENIQNVKALESGAGLWAGSTVFIRGIGYKLTEDQIEDGVFDNTVHSTATNKTKSKTLNGQDVMRVFLPADPMYYEWAGHDLSVTKTKLVTDVLAAANQEGNPLYDPSISLTTSNVNGIELVTKNGNAITSNYVTIDDSTNDLTINYPTTGSKVFYVKITYSGTKNIIVPVLVNVTDVVNSVYVLDYGLSVNLTENNELFKNDSLTVPGRTTDFSLIAIGSGGGYSPNEITFTSANTVNGSEGEFTYSGGTITYTPTDFMDNVDTIQVAVNVYESGITPSNITGTLNINKEVEMYKNISVLPATVVYYEDDFPAITYSMNSDGDTVENTFTHVGEGSGNLSQSNDQDQEYGQDEAYQNNSDMSGNSLTKITIADSDMTASFMFKGTGFELISRTNATDSATLTVKVKDADGNVVKNIPVITEYDNGSDGGTEEIYQVPVIRVEDLLLGTYTVEISGAPAYTYKLDANGNYVIENGNLVKTGTIPTYLYIDGLRIYQPMGETNDNYLATENGADFIEIRDQIINGTIASVVYNGQEITASTATTTWTEKYEDENYSGIIYEGNKVSSVNEYLLQGPNNEVYMTGDSTTAALVFYVAETGSGIHNLQIAVHAVDVGLFYGTNSTGMNAAIQYGVKNGDTFAWTPLVTVKSGTEQYYTIDYTNAPYVEGKGYQIAVSVKNNDTTPSMASFTSLKLNGLELVSIGGESTTLYYDNGVLKDAASGVATASEDYLEFETVSQQMRSTLLVMSLDDEEPTEEPEETEPEETEPEETEPEETEPEETEPEETEPEETKPEETEPEETKPEETEPEETKPEKKPEEDRKDDHKGNDKGNKKEESFPNEISREKKIRKLLEMMERLRRRR